MKSDWTNWCNHHDDDSLGSSLQRASHNTPLHGFHLQCVLRCDRVQPVLDRPGSSSGSPSPSSASAPLLVRGHHFLYRRRGSTAWRCSCVFFFFFFGSQKTFRNEDTPFFCIKGTVHLKVTLTLMLLHQLAKCFDFELKYGL